MTDRDLFEERLAVAVREFAEAAPTAIDASAFTRDLAANVQRRRLVPQALRTPRPTQLVRIVLVPALVVVAIVFGGLLSGFRPSFGGPGSHAQTATQNPTTAVGPFSVTMTAEMSITGALRPNVGTFEAAGPAVDQHVICARGLVDDLSVIDTSLLQTGQDVDFTLDKRFTCDDETGTFTLRLQVHISASRNAETISWVALSGTGAYAGIRGGGSGSTRTGASSTQAVNTYVGFLGR